MADGPSDEIELSEEQKGKPGINDWVELRGARRGISTASASARERNA